MRPPAVRLLAVAAALASLGTAFLRAQPPAPPPADTSSSTNMRVPGKFVWADLFTSDANASANFYTELFGWSASYRSKRGKTFAILSNNGRPIAAVVQRRNSGNQHLARWISYISVDDINATISAANSAGGHVLAPAKSYSGGTHAIIADPEGTPIGLTQANKGDQTDYPNHPGDWAWFELFAKDPQTVGRFYTEVFHYQIAPDSRGTHAGHYILATGEDHRAGIQPMPVEPDAQPDWLPFVEVGDLDATVAHLQTLGGTLLEQPAPAEYGTRYAVISDPTGGVIGIVQFVTETTPATATPPGEKADTTPTTNATPSQNSP